MNTIEKKRYYYIDNIKALLIFAVVLGHLCEVMSFSGKGILYMLIYVFHMPAFAFCSGIFATFNKRKIFENLIYPYLIFQTLYVLFDHYLLKNSPKLQYTKPYWLMWYLLAMIIWECALPLFQDISRTKKLLVILIAFALSLFVGRDENVSYVLSLSRILVLFPFFILGYYFKQSSFFIPISTKSCRTSKNFKFVRDFLAILVGIIIFILIKKHNAINPKWLYDSYSYTALQYNYHIRGYFMLCAFIITAFLFFAMPDIKIPIVTRIGEHTFPIFLLHGFCVRAFSHYHLLERLPHPQYMIFFVSFGITLFFSSRILTWLLAPIFHFSRSPFILLQKPLKRLQVLCSIFYRYFFKKHFNIQSFFYKI